MTDTPAGVHSTTLLEQAIFEAAAAARWSQVETARNLAWARALPLAEREEVMDRAANRWYRDYIDMYEDPSGYGERSAYAFREQFAAAHLAAIEEIHEALSRFPSPDPHERALSDCVAAAVRELHALHAPVPTAAAPAAAVASVVPAAVVPMTAAGPTAVAPTAVAPTAVVPGVSVVPVVPAGGAPSGMTSEEVNLAALVGKPDEWLTERQVAEFAGVQRRTTFAWRRNNDFPEPEVDGAHNGYSLIKVVTWMRANNKVVDLRRLPSDVLARLEAAREKLRERDANERDMAVARQSFEEQRRREGMNQQPRR